MNLTTSTRILAACIALSSLPFAAQAENPMVGGAAMFENKNIVENAMNSADHTTLVSAVQAAGLAETLQGPGPFTVFAPTNEAFDMLPAGTVDTLLTPENKAMLTKVLTAHVVAGDWTAAKIAEKAGMSSDGLANFTTVSGDALSAKVQNGMILVYDESGTVANVTIADVDQSNGVIHVVDHVLVPK